MVVQFSLVQFNEFLIYILVLRLTLFQYAIEHYIIIQTVRFAFEKSCFEKETKQYSLALQTNPCRFSTFKFTLLFLVTHRN